MQTLEEPLKAHFGYNDFRPQSEGHEHHLLRRQRRLSCFANGRGEVDLLPASSVANARPYRGCVSIDFADARSSRQLNKKWFSGSLSQRRSPL